MTKIPLLLVTHFRRNTSDNFNGGFTLPVRTTESEGTSHEIQLTETAILNANTINETRFQYRTNSNDRTGDSSIPTINVSGAFVGGGAGIRS